jgi:hypothetical protein
MFLVYFNIPKQSWNGDEQKSKPVKDFSETNQRLRKLNSFLSDTYDKIFPMVEAGKRSCQMKKHRTKRGLPIIYRE